MATQFEPQVAHRPTQHYVAIKAQVTQPQIPQLLPPLLPEVQAWLAARQIAPAGAPFFRYISCIDNLFEVEVGFPVAEALEGEEQITTGTSPEGTYAVLTITGPYTQIPQAHQELSAFIKRNDFTMAGPAIEVYLIGPATEPNPEKWQTEILLMVEPAATLITS
ncbi:MAG: GyrI-like domain-containing protein [Rufibacter sp.]